MDIDPPARSTPPLADDSSNTSLTTALSTAPTSEERPVTAIDLATQARERVKAKKAAAAAALEAARLATAAPAAIVVPEVREENGNESSELSALDEPEEAMRPRRVRSQRTPNPVVDDPDDDDLDLPATADPYVAARAKSRAGTVTATDDDGPGAAKRRTTRQADLEEARMQKAAEVEERQVKKTKKLAALSGGKYSLASLKRDREKTDKLAASNLANASKVQAILEGPDPDIHASPKKNQQGALAHSMDHFANNTRIGEEDSRNAAVNMVREEMNDEDIEAEDPSLAARRFWRTGVDAISEVKSYVPPELPAGASSYLRRLHQACQDTDKPLNCSICPARPGAVGRNDALTSAPWLFDIVSHPALPVELVEASRYVLFATLQQAAGTLTQRKNDKAPLPLSAATIESAFVRLGMRKMDQANGVDNGLSTSESPMAVDMEPTDKIAFTTEQRYQAIVRILRVVATLGDIGARTNATGDYIELVKLLVRLLLDVSSASLLSDIEAALHALVKPCFGSAEDLISLFDALLSTILPHTAQAQHAVLAQLPHRSRAQRRFRRWLALALLIKAPSWKALTELEPSQALLVHGFTLAAPAPFAPLVSLIERNRPTSPFNLTRKFNRRHDDQSLYYHARILQFAVCDLFDELEDGSPGWGESRADAVRLATKLDTLQNIIPTNVGTDASDRMKAKTTFTQIGHALIYQVPALPPVKQQLGIEAYFTRRDSSAV